jgi:3-hydroxyacyl-CoA dehydrogenase/enoyl-CoA hydratase/3-hydroxybutyryl-CoA epimerase
MAPAESIGAMVAAGRLGRKAGRGFYLYQDGHKTDPDPAAYQVMGVKPLAEVDRGMVERRLVYALLNEAARARGEQVVRSNRDGDIGAIFGIGFPPFRGGPLRMIENLGPATVAATLAELTTRFGPRFTPADVLREDGETA